jgi:hypothetical protein
VINNRLNLAEILRIVSEEGAKAKRVELLRELLSRKPILKQVFYYTYSDEVEWDLPEGNPPFEPLDMPENWGYNRLPSELRKMKYFLKGNTLNSIKRENVFITLLESVSPEEAELLLMMKNRKLDYKGLNKKFIEENFPELLVS